MTKEEKIKEAWGIHFDKMEKRGKEQALEDNGYCHKNYVNSEIYFEIESLPYPDNEFIRPKSLNGIENNNGWIKIESESDLPKLTIEYYVLKNGSLTTAYYRGNNRWIIPENDFPKTTEIHKITHYQPIEKPKPPIY